MYPDKEGQNHVFILPVENHQSCPGVGFALSLNKIRDLLVKTLMYYEETDFEGKF